VPLVRDRVPVRSLAEEQASLRRVATLVAEGAPAAEVFSAVAREVAEVMGFRSAAVARFDDDGTTMTIVALSDDRPHGFQPGTRWPLDGPSMSAEVLRTGRPVRVEDYTDISSSLAAEARESGLNRIVGAPIIVDGRVWGVISTASPEAPFPDDVEDRLAEFTELVATAIANSQAREELTRLVEDQAALRRVATLAAQGAAPAEVFAAVSAEVARLIPADGAALTRFEADGTVTALSGWTSRGGYVYVGKRYDLEGTVSGLVYETQRPARIDDYADQPGEAAVAGREMGWRSSVGVPLIVEGRLWGVLAVVSTTERPLPPDTERRLGDFTELVATAIANAEGRNEVTRLAEEQAALRRVATLVAEGTTPAEVFEAVIAEVGRLIPADAAALTRYETDGTVTIIGGWSRSNGYVAVGARHPLGRGTMVRLVFETCRPGRIDSYTGASGSLGGVVRDEMGWRSAVGAPIVVEGRLWGVLGIGSTTDSPLPPDSEERLAEFTDLVATAVANTESREELRVRSEEQAALRSVATLVARGGPAPEVLDAVAAEVDRLLGADWAGVHRYDSDGAMTVLASHGDLSPNIPIGARAMLQDEGESESVAAAVKRTGRSARIESFQDLPGSWAARGRELGVRSAVGAPITVEGELWGVAIAVWTQPGPVPIVDAERLLAGFTELVATAIANAESREELASLADEQAALRRVATLVAEGARPDEVFAAVAGEVARMLGVPIAVMLRFDPDGTATILASAGAEFGPSGTRWPIEDASVVAAVFETGRAARMDDFSMARGAAAEAVRETGVRWAVGVPIIVEGALWGVMTAGSRESEPVAGWLEDRLAKFTQLLATAIANAESRAELDSSRARIVATADATRRRIERDLHDGAQQRLVSLALEVRAVQASVPPELGGLREELSRVAAGHADVLDELREIARGIHPAVLADGGLGPALKTLARRSPVPVELDTRVEGRLPERVEVAAFYVVSEALANVAKYACASVVQVDVGTHDGFLRVSVRDDGLGGADPDVGSGLLGLKDRAEAIGGTISLDSPPGAGTSLVVELPVDEQDR